MPATSATVATMPRMPETVMPAGTVPIFPPRTIAALTGTGTLSLVSRAAAAMKLAGSGALSLLAVPHAFTTAALTGVGTLKLAVLNQSTKAALTGVGTLTMKAAAEARAALAGTGALATTASAATKAALAGSGVSAMTASTATTAALTGAGTLALDVTLPVPMGIQKNGNQTPTAGSYNTVTNWIVKPGYADTVPSGSGMALRTGKYTVFVRLEFDDNNNEVTVQIRKAGTVIATGPLVALGSNTFGTWTFNNVSWPTAGEVLDIQMKPKYNDAIVSGVNTYVTATPA
jgi:hypothetical protein